MNAMNVRTTVYDQIQVIAADQNKTLPTVTDDLGLLASGLDSLCIALLIAALDDTLGLDPFGTGEATKMPVTVGDLIDIYEHATT